MAFADIRSEHVLGAIALLGDPAEGPRLLEELHFGEARSYRLVYKGKFFDSKPVVGIAHGLVTGDYLTSADFTGGYRGAEPVLRRLGFHVDYGFLYVMTKLRVDRTHGRPAPYQYVVLLWAISRVLGGGPRMVPFKDAREELAQLLAPFAVATTAPDLVMPWIALASAPRTAVGDWLWDLETPNPPEKVTDAQVKSLNLSAGLSEEFARYIKSLDRSSFVEALIDVVATKIGSERAYLPLLERLGFMDTAPFTGSREDPIADVQGAIEELANPRRKRFGRLLTAAQNKAIEVRAVQVVREHFEIELGYSTEDVGATESYDVWATKGDAIVMVEVKGTTTSGASVILTRNEVSLHRGQHPANALAVVHSIRLDREAEEPTASGGELQLWMPWSIDEADLSPLAYEYRTGL